MDLESIIKQKNAIGGMATMEEIQGMANMVTHIQQMLKIMESNPDDKERVKQYKDALGQLENYIRGFAQRLKEQKQTGNGQSQMDPKDAAKIQATIIGAKTKAEITKQSHAERTAQRQTAFELEEQRKDRQHNADMRRETDKAALELTQNRLKSFRE